MFDETQIRALVRDAVARHLGPAGETSAVPSPVAGPAVGHPSRQAPWTAHASHGLLPVPAGSAIDGPCLIEPTVSCVHCGYCQSFGH